MVYTVSEEKVFNRANKILGDLQTGSVGNSYTLLQQKLGESLPNNKYTVVSQVYGKGNLALAILDKRRSPTYLESIAHISFTEPIHNTTMSSITPFIKTHEFSTMPNIVYNDSIFNPALIMFIVKELDLEEFDVTFDFTSGIYTTFTNFYKGGLQIVYRPFRKDFLIGVDFQVSPNYNSDEIFQQDIKRFVNCDYENLTMCEMTYNIDYTMTLQDLDALLVEKNHHQAFLQKMVTYCNRCVKEQWVDLQTITADDDEDDGDFVY